MKTLEERVAALEAKLAELLMPNASRPVFTKEREALLRERWQAGDRAGDIMDKLNTLPAPLPVRTAQSVMQQAKFLGLKRPEGWRNASYVTAPTIWTDERRDMLGNLVNLILDADLLEKLNALPGPKVKSIDAMRLKAQRLGFLSERPRKPGPHEATWTAERKAFLRAQYGRMMPADLFTALQAMPGTPLASPDAIRRAAVRYGIKSAREIPNGFAPGNINTPRRHTKPAAPAPAKQPEPQPEPLTLEQQEANVANMLARREEQAMALFAKGRDPASVSATLKIHLREAYRLAGLYRQQKQEAA